MVDEIGQQHNTNTNCKIQGQSKGEPQKATKEGLSEFVPMAAKAEFVQMAASKFTLRRPEEGVTNEWV